MKVQICSDLHLEFTANKSWLKENPILPSGDILIIAGDTNYLSRDFSNIDFINKIKQGDEDLLNGKGKKVTLEELDQLWK